MAWVLVVLLLLPDPAAAKQAAQRILSEGGYQTRLPHPVAEPAEREVTPTRTRDPWPDRNRSSFDLPEPDTSFLAGLMKALVWTVFGVGIAVLLFWLGRTLMGRRRDVRPGATPAEAAAAPAPSLASPAAELAARGDYAGAIHALLLEALAGLGQPLAPAWTSWDIVGRLALPEGARDALSELVRTVEVTRFGGRAAGRTEYERCAARALEVRGG